MSNGGEGGEAPRPPQAEGKVKVDLEAELPPRDPILPPTPKVPVRFNIADDDRGRNIMGPREHSEPEGQRIIIIKKSSNPGNSGK